MEIEELSNCEALPLLSLNHVSLLCRSVWNSLRFYEEVLGFVVIKRPSSFNFNGAWLAFFLSEHAFYSMELFSYAAKLNIYDCLLEKKMHAFPKFV